MFQQIKQKLLQNNSEKQTVAKNVFWLMGSEIVVRFFRFFLIIYVARILGAEGWGLFSYALSFIGMFFVFSDAGISTLFIKEYASQKTRYIKAMMSVKIFLLTVSMVVTIAAGFSFASLPINTLVIPVVGLLFFDSIRSFISTFLQSHEKMELEALIKTVANIALILTVIILVGIYPTPTSLAFGYMIGSALGLAVAIVITFPILKKLKNIISSTTLKRGDLKNVLRFIFPIALTGLASSIIVNTDSIMLGIWKDAVDVGWYASAQRISQFTLIIPGIFVTALFPTLSKIYSENRERFTKIAQKSFSLLFTIGTPIAFGGFIVANSLILFLFGAEYSPSGNAFASIIIGSLFVFPGTIFYTVSVITETQKRISYHVFSAIVINIIINAILIPRFGVVGAAIATTITQIYLFVLNGLFFKNICKLPGRDIRDVTVASLIMITFLLLIPGTHVIIRTVLAAGVYLGILFLFKNSSLQMFVNMITKKAD